jgi:hypothetical protein
MSSSNGAAAVVAAVAAPPRSALPRERKSLTHRFEIAGHEGYVTVGLYEDGSPGELFLNGFAKSIPDYLARWLALRFLDEAERELHGIRVSA